MILPVVELLRKTELKKQLCREYQHSGLEQLMYVYQHLQFQAPGIIPKQHTDLDNLVALDGSLINATLSMHWPDYRKK